MQIWGRVGLVLCMAAIVCSCDKEPNAGDETRRPVAVEQVGLKAETVSAHAAVTRVAGIEWPVQLTERSRDERPGEDGSRAMVARFNYTGTAESVGLAVKKALTTAGYRISETAEDDGSKKFVGRTDSQRIAVVVSPADLEVGRGMVAFFWQEGNPPAH